MKAYKRLTERRGGLVIDNCGNCPNVNNEQGCDDKKCHEIKKNRLADLEDKIKSGELCEREAVRKETAREIYEWFLKHARCSSEYELVGLFKKVFNLEEQQ